MTTITIVIAGAPHWAREVETTLGSEYRVLHYNERGNYIARLADDRAALIVVNGDDRRWRFWTTTPKISPATRRVPIILVTDKPAVRREAFLAGADLHLAPGELLAQIKTLVTDYARVPDAKLVAQLDEECQERLPPLGVEGVQKFNARQYYPQHDLFEAQWVKTSGPVRDLYRASLQVGIAYYQIERGNHRGAMKMLLRSVQWLSILPDVCQGVDVKQLREDSYRVRAELERIKPEDISTFDRSLLKPVQLTKES
jgi:predicted metal-dependent hydrolase